MQTNSSAQHNKRPELQCPGLTSLLWLNGTTFQSLMSTFCALDGQSVDTGVDQEHVSRPPHFFERHSMRNRNWLCEAFLVCDEMWVPEAFPDSPLHNHKEVCTGEKTKDRSAHTMNCFWQVRQRFWCSASLGPQTILTSIQLRGFSLSANRLDCVSASVRVLPARLCTDAQWNMDGPKSC